jgi:hypothetical protein
MNELVDTSPDVDVEIAEYRRLLGYPRGHALSGRALDLIDKARSWFAANGSPWVYARQAHELAITNGSVAIDGQSFHSSGLQSSLRQSQAESVFLVAVSAGPEIELESERRWLDEKPDEYFFLEVYGSAVVEHLVTMCGARLCAWAEPQRMAVLPHMSPGYVSWDIAQQPQLLRLIRAGSSALPGQLEALSSGMLRPKKSLLAVFGVTRHTASVRRLAELNPCERCSYLPCQYRRAAYQLGQQFSGIMISGPAVDQNFETSAEKRSLDHAADYTVNRKALARWAAERLTLTEHADGSIDALFRYEGTTCTNLGRRLLFDYHVKLGPADDGYPIQSQQCVPAPGDEGYTSMCRYIENPATLLAAIDREKPLHEEPLNGVLAWESPVAVAGCYCEHSDRMHKWRIVLETIHYALVEHERQHSRPTAKTATLT